jgi:DNA-binding NarL/FixJ family response regulator
MKGHMEESFPGGQLRMIVLKWDRLSGDLIRQTIGKVWSHAEVQVFQRGIEALAAIDTDVPDMFITGVKVPDMDGLEHLEPFIETSLPILVVTTRPDFRTFEMLRAVRFDGVFDGRVEGWDHLAKALQKVLQHERYFSASLLEFLKPPKNVTLDALTEMEQMVLSVIGDGSDNAQASERLQMSPETVGSHRKRIMAKLRLHHKGQLMSYAMTHGYVLWTPDGIFQPGFQRKLAAGSTDKRRGGRPRKDASGPVRAPDPEIAQAAFLLARSRAQESAVVKE